MIEAKEGDRFWISLTYDAPTTAAETSAQLQTDTCHGRFLRLVPNTEVVQIVEFESDDPRMKGEMTVQLHAGRHPRRHGSRRGCVPPLRERCHTHRRSY